METTKKQIAKDEFVAEKIAGLSVLFYDTPESLFMALFDVILNLKMTESEVSDMINEAILTVKKTKVTIADIVSCRRVGVAL